MKRATGLLVCVGVVVSGCLAAADDMGSCPDPVVLAAGGNASLALSCAAPQVIFDSMSYDTWCFPLHVSRVGDLLAEVDSSDYTHVRRVRGFKSSEAIVLSGNDSCGGERQLGIVDFSENGFQELYLPHPSAEVSTPEIVLPFEKLSSNHTVSIFVGAPDDATWGLETSLQKLVDGRWKSIYYIATNPNAWTGRFRRLDRFHTREGQPIAIPGIGFQGNAIVRIKLPPLTRDFYRLKKEFSMGMDDDYRERVVTVRFLLRRPGS